MTRLRTKETKLHKMKNALQLQVMMIHLLGMHFELEINENTDCIGREKHTCTM